MADNALTRMGLAGQLGVSLFIALVIGGLFWWQYLSPAMAEEQTKTAQLDTLKREIAALEVTANKLAEFQREVALLEAKLETLKRILPPEKETPDLMRKVQSLASQSSLLIKSFTPGATINKEFYQEWPITMTVEGNYHNLGIFFDRVGRLSRLVNIGNIRITSRGEQTVSNTISASCVATTFVYVETPVAPAAPAKAPAKGAKR